MITAIVPTYRRPKMLKQALRSILDQTYADLSIVVCDNASGDETEMIVKDLAERDPRIHYYCQPKNIPYFENYQKGLSLVKTPYFSYVGDDDCLLPNFYADAVESLEKHTEAAFFSSGTLWCDEDGKIICKWTLNQNGLLDMHTCPIKHIQNPVWLNNLYSIVFRRVFPDGALLNITKEYSNMNIYPWYIELVSKTLIKYKIFNRSEFYYIQRQHRSNFSKSVHGTKSEHEEAYSIFVSNLMNECGNDPYILDRTKSVLSAWNLNGIPSIGYMFSPFAQTGISENQLKNPKWIPLAKILKSIIPFNLVKSALRKLLSSYRTIKYYVLYSGIQRKNSKFINKYITTK